MWINHAKGYIEEKNGNKYFAFPSIDENKELLKNYADVWNGIKNKIKEIIDGKENNYEKDYMKLKFNSDDDLLLNKLLNFHAMTITIRSVCKWCFVWVTYIKMIENDRIFLNIQ